MTTEEPPRLQPAESGSTDRAAPPSALRRTGRAGHTVVRKVVTEPVNEGRLRPDGWPLGLGPIVITAGLLSVVLVGLTVAGDPIRRHSEMLYLSPSSTLPRWVLPILVAALVFAVSCLYVGALHVWVVVRIPILVVVVAVVIRTLFYNHLGADTVPALTGAGLLLLFAALRWRARFAWWEFLVAIVIIGGSIGYSLIAVQRVYGGGSPSTPLNAFVMMSALMWFLALPFATLAGARISELLSASVVAASASAVSLIKRPVPADEQSRDQSPRQQPIRGRTRTVIMIGLGVLIVARAVQIGVKINTDDEYRPGLLASGSLTLTLPLLILVPLLLTGRGRIWFAELDGDAGLQSWRSRALLIAAVPFVFSLGPLFLSELSASFGLDRISTWLFDLKFDGALVNEMTFAALALLVVAYLDRRRNGRWSLLVLFFAWVFADRAVNTAIDLPAAGQGSLVLASALAAGLALVLGLRGRLSIRQAGQLASVLLLTGLWEYRNVITEPLTALLALTGVSVGLVVGVLWRLLTDNAYGNGESERFPRTARVLLVLANAIFGTAGIALVALQAGISATDLRSSEQLGDTQVGFTLVLAVVLLQLIATGFVSDQSAAPPALGVDPGGPVVETAREPAARRQT